MEPAARVSVARILDEGGVVWAVLRGAVDPTMPAGDLDVLVAPAETARALGVLREAGFVRLPWGGPSHGVLRFDLETSTWQWLDVHASIGTRVRQVPGHVVGELLARRRRIDGLWMLDPADEFWVVLIGVLFDGRPLRERHRRRLEELLPRDQDPSMLRPLVDQFAGERGFAATVRTLVADRAWTDIESLARAPRRSRRLPLRRLVDGLRALTDPARRGITLALLGPDGAGKSTTAQAIADAFPFPSRRLYMGVGGPPDKGGRRPFPFLVASSAAGFGLQWVRYLVGRYHQLRGRLVIFDRYMEDAWLPQPAEPSSLRRAGRRIRTLLTCPPADVMVVLDTSGAAMFERKREHDPDWLEAQRQRYLRLAASVPSIAVVATTGTPARTIGQINALVWQRYQERIGGAPAHR